MVLNSKSSQASLKKYVQKIKKQPTLKSFIALSQRQSDIVKENKRNISEFTASLNNVIQVKKEDIETTHLNDASVEQMPCRIRKRIKRCLSSDVEDNDNNNNNISKATQQHDLNSTTRNIEQNGLHSIGLKLFKSEDPIQHSEQILLDSSCSSTTCSEGNLSHEAQSSNVNPQLTSHSNCDIKKEAQDCTRQTLSVLDLTYSAHEEVWPQLQLSESSNLVDLGESSVKKKYARFFDASSSDTHASHSSVCKTLHVDWKQWLRKLPAAMNSKYFQEYVDVVCSLEDVWNPSCIENTNSETKPGPCSLPSWILPHRITDRSGRRPDDPNYDVNTLWIPEAKEMRLESKHSTPAMLQYWKIKQDHFDKIIFFKFGKFYEIFYIDAFIINRFCNLRWIACDEKPHVGFPESCLHQYAEKVVTNGFKVVVVEQMETPKELTERNREVCGENRAKAIKREICDVFSIGTLFHEAMLPNESRFLMAVYYEDHTSGFGFAYTDVSTCQLWVGDCRPDIPKANDKPLKQFDGILSPVSQAFRTLMSQVLPIEVVFDPAFIPPTALVYFKQMPVSPHVNAIRARPSRDMSFALELIQRQQEQRHETSRVKNSVEKKNANVFHFLRESNTALIAFSFLCQYLESVLLLEKVMSFARFQHRKFNFLGTLMPDKETKKDVVVLNAEGEIYRDEDDAAVTEFKTRLIMDSVALRHLHIVQGKDGKEAGSLFAFVNQTVTPMGKRLLKRWIIAPLRLVSHINRRLDCTTWFLKNSKYQQGFREDLKKLGDIERTLTRFCTRSLQKFRTAVYFDNIHSKYFREFVEMLDSFKSVYHCLENIAHHADQEELPPRLKELCCFLHFFQMSHQTDPYATHTELFEDIRSCLLLDPSTKEWGLANNVDATYDKAFTAMEDIKLSLNQYLSDLLHKAKKKQMLSSRCEIRYTHSKFPYEIEVPQHDLFVQFVQSQDDTAKTVTSSRQGYIRFRTEAILEYVAELEEASTALKDVLYGCQQRLFQKFYSKYYDLCLRMISSISEIDIYIGFSILASLGNPDLVPASQHMCRPCLVSPQPGTAPILRLINSRHPLVALALSINKHYVTNDIRINDPEDNQGCHSFFLVTGPNMGGKSTLLRQTCLAVILAQLGSYVPASQCVLNPVDRIFTRIGAYDAILEGRSAFLVELEESVPAAIHSTEFSLVILDEFGRGTSSCDGAALALALAEQLATVNKTRCLFSSHFQLLLDELSSLPSVRCVHMGVSSDAKSLFVTFLYKLLPGTCSRSHGIHVAQLAGIPPKIISAANQRCDQLHKNASIIHFLLRLRNSASKALELLNQNPDQAISWDTLITQFSEFSTADNNVVSQF